LPTIIRRATLSDVDIITPLYSGYREFYRQAAEPERERSFLTERLRTNESTIFVAIDDESGSPLGFTQLYPMFSSVRMKRIWVLNDLFVDSGSRGKGIAAALMEQAESFAWETSAAGLELATEKNNSPAQALYEKRGWQLDDDYFHYSLNRQ